jgi:hypothetical protein
MTDMASASEPTCYCAFVDILAFSDVIARLENGTIQFQTLRNLLARVHNPMMADQHLFHYTDFRAQSISDAVAISTECTRDALSQLLFSLQQLELDLLAEGFFVRGAIVKDSLYHDDNMVFGPALIRAYQIESQVARFPRIMITREVMADGLAAPNSDLFLQWIRQAEDGPMYLHVLWKPHIELQKFPPHLGFHDRAPTSFERYLAMASWIRRRFEEVVDNPRHFEKVQWFARYWNSILPKDATEPYRIRGPGVELPISFSV